MKVKLLGSRGNRRAERATVLSSISSRPYMTRIALYGAEYGSTLGVSSWQVTAGGMTPAAASAGRGLKRPGPAVAGDL